MSRIVNRFAAVMPHVCLLLAILAPVAVIAIMALVPAESFATNINLPERARAHFELGWEKRLIVALIILLPIGCLSYALMEARSSLRRFNCGEYFSTSSIRGIRGFAAGIFWGGLLTLAIGPIATLVATGSYSARTLMFRVDISTLVMLTIGGILWQIAVIMQRGAELAEENRQFV